jgi:hypothetical protein
MRDDRLARTMDERRWAFHRQSTLTPLPAEELRRRQEPPVSGREVADVYGLLAHYTTVDRLALYAEAGQVGAGKGVWLTPTPYAACMAPYALGLDDPRDLCLLIDVSDLRCLWGPGTTPPSRRFPGIWLGGGVEFYSADPIPIVSVRRIYRIRPCGDGSR